MSFNSPQFLMFLPIVLVLYWVIPHKFRWALLLVASYFFYMSWDERLIVLILATTLVSYGAGLLIEKTDKKGKKKLLLIFTIVFCIGTLVFFKYSNFLIENVVNVMNAFGSNVKDIRLAIILPIGISFYTFQTMSYVIDVYKGKIPAEKHLGYYALFVCFFPQLVAGPIERPADLIPQLKAEHKLNYSDLAKGFKILLVGFFYKCAVADVLQVYVNKVFANAESSNGLAIFIAGFLFTVQMYCDFAGYSEIATGSARMMGIKLSLNFNKPFRSESYSDFFRRWHITLTRWFTDYVYIPLGGNRKGLFRRVLNTFIVFILCGLWHGANWTYLCWGAYAAFFLNIETLLKKPVARFNERFGIDPKSPTVTALKIIGMYFILIPAAIIFRAESVSHAGILLSRLFTSWNIGAGFFESAMQSLGLSASLMLQAIVLMISEVVLCDYAFKAREDKEIVYVPGKESSTAFARECIIVIFMITVIALCWTGLLSTGGTSAFQYFQF